MITFIQISVYYQKSLKYVDTEKKFKNIYILNKYNKIIKKKRYLMAHYFFF